jgi:hypothetical protein
LGVSAALLIGVSGGHEIGFATGCIDSLPHTYADAAEKAQGFMDQRWAIIPYHGMSRGISLGADGGASVDFQSNFGFERPYSWYEDFGHGISIGTDASEFSGDINRGCCRQPFAKDGSPFRFLWDEWHIPSPFDFSIYYPVPPFITSDLAGGAISGPVYAEDMEVMVQEQATLAKTHKAPTAEQMSLIAAQTSASTKEGMKKGFNLNIGYGRGCRRFDFKGLWECFNKFNSDGTTYFDP